MLVTSVVEEKVKEKERTDEVAGVREGRRTCRLNAGSWSCGIFVSFFH